jgi:PAS domain S-box-containing protein
MSDKSIYQELKKRVRDLERAAARRLSDEDDLHEAAEKYHIHFSLANDVIYTIDRDFVVTSVSPSVERVLGYKPEELVGRSVAEVRVIPPSYLDKAMRETMQVLRGSDHRVDL